MQPESTVEPAAAPLVTIGLPFSQERVSDFRLALQSVFAQSYTHWELLLMADAASEPLLRYANRIRDPRVRLICDGHRRGLPRRLNQLAGEAAGVFLARMDADDVMHPERLARSVSVLASSPNIEVVSTSAFQIDEASRITGIFRGAEFSTVRRDIFLNSPIVHPTVITRTEWSIRNRYDEHYTKAQDKELWVRALTPESYRRVSIPLLYYRVADRLRYSKHALTNHFDRTILRTYGPSQLGALTTANLLLRSYAKQAAFGALLALGQSRYLYNRKFVALPDTSIALTALNTVMATQVPGADDE